VWLQFGDYQLSYISGIILNKKEDQLALPSNEEPIEDQSDSMMDVDVSEESKLAEPEASARDKQYILDVARSESMRFHKPVMIGDVKLSEFRNLLQSRGFSVDFLKGVLIVNGRVMVRKDGHNLRLEGGINADYFSVRRLLYELHAII
jgi:cleavage and polyadenylation specificity factor subunit 2